MADQSSRHNRGRRRRRRGYPRDAEVFPMCPVCERAVRDLASAITHRESGQPAHFDCILKVLREANALLENEKICYLGKGSFGIVQFRANASPLRFFIRKRIQYEEPAGIPDWRRIPARNLSGR